MKIDENKMECPVCGTYMVKCGQCEYIHFRCPNHEVSCMVPIKMFKSKYNKEDKHGRTNSNQQN
jgi:hypothetical protein